MDHLVEGLVSQILTTQAEHAASEDKRFKLIMEMEDRWEEREANVRLEERKHEEDHRVE